MAEIQVKTPKKHRPRKRRDNHREKVYQILLIEYGRVIQRERKKPEETLQNRMSEGYTYKEFLDEQLADVISTIGPFQEGPSFFEKIYTKNFKDGNFDKITAKNLILTYRYRIENILYPKDQVINNRLISYIQKVIGRLVDIPDFIGSFNLQEKNIRHELIEAVRHLEDRNFVKSAIDIIENQSLRIMNSMNELFVQKLTETLVVEKNLKAELLARQKIMEEELKRARKIQQNLLPKAFPLNSGLKFYALYIPIAGVGGDFYDVVILNEKEIDSHRPSVGILIADVSGHGVPAAFIASMTKISWQNSVRVQSGTLEILKRVNSELYGNTAGNFLTAIAGIFHPSASWAPGNRKGVLLYSSAGHFSPYLIRRSSESFPLDVKGYMIGVFPTIKLEENSVDYYSGDRFVFYTDGFLEAKNPEGEIFGEERLFSLFKEGSSIKGDLFCEFVLNRIRDFSKTTNQEDDLTLLVIDVD